MEKWGQLMNLQDERLESIKKAQINYGKTAKARITTSYLDTRLENLELAWNSFKNTHEHLIENISKESRDTFTYFKDDSYEICEEIYFAYKSDLKTKIHELTATAHASALPEPKTSVDIKLPRIVLPQFSGRYTDWQSYHDYFNSIIHTNTAIDDVQKLHYLKSSLSGEAEQLLRTIQITSQNYTQAWETLKNRYNNKRYIANCIFKRLFGMRNITSESAFHIKQHLDTTVECLSSLNNLGLPIKSWDAIIIYLTVSKLDSESHKLWEQHISSGREDFPSFNSLKGFLENRFRSLEMIEHTDKPARPKTFTASVGIAICSFCKECHYIYQCKQFANLQYKDKYEFVQNNNLCFNCLIPNHTANKCMRNTSCRICHKKHHSLLHTERKEESVKGDCQNSKQNIVSHLINQPGQILLATALVDVTSRHGQTQVYRALIDQGSQASFVTEDLVQTMGLKKIHINGVVSGLSEGKQLRTKYMVEVKLQSRHNTNFTIHVNAYVLRSITNYLPAQSIAISSWRKLEELTLADPTFNTPNKIQLLLGAEVYSKIIEVELIKSPFGIIAQKTQLGWILSGDTNKTKPETKQNRIINMHVCVCENEILRKFWEIENETLTCQRKLTKEEKRCEDIYKETTIRTESGRYLVRLPFKEDVDTPVNKCGLTKQLATARFLLLERKLEQNRKLKEDYTKVIKDYEKLGYMMLADEEKKDAIYLPHHAVIRNDKDTTKLRVVLDASAKGSKGYSLNDTLLTGPVLQKDLRTLIIQWRQHKIVLVSDIVKMYHQVLVHDQHTDYQRIIWRANPQENLKSYKLLTVTFGTACAPYLAVRTLLQVAEDEKEKYPLAAEIVKSSFYMDDLMSGACDETQAVEIYNQTNELLRSAGFMLQKWSSNSDKVLKMIEQTKEEIQPYEIKFDKVIKILGIVWDRNDDKFKISVHLPDVKYPVTKRNVISDVARLFDPFGWVAPVIIRAKVLIQKLWLCNVHWDEKLPINLVDEWLTFRKQLLNLKNIEIERWIHTRPDNDRIELVGFADASTSAYAAVLYVRVIQGDEVYVNILECKTKVAPLKQISIPKLELCAAVLLAKLLAETTNNLKIPKQQVYAYTDSSVVLAWIQSQPIRWHTFVANRITEIQTRLDNDRWNHITSEENPADIASRGIEPFDLKHNQLWWHGPSWMMNKVINTNKIFVPETKLEERKQYTKVFFNKTEDILTFERFSTLNRMIRVLTWCRRWLNMKEKKEIRKTYPIYLTVEEIKTTLYSCIKVIQNIEFEEELMDLKQKNRVKKRSKLISLTPYIDENGLLRVGGRLQAAKISQNQKHPIIIPNKTYLGELLIRDAHARVMHGGTALTMNYLRSRYWIIGLKSLVKRHLSKCVVCARYNANTRQPLMGELSRVRVNPGRPFSACGVDFAGPIQMRVSKGRGHRSFKGYISLFICMKTKAIHLEAVSDLTTQGFIAAFRRFTSRRGHCTDMYSDNGLNFVGAANELSQMLNQCMSSVVKEVAELLENDGTKWHFIPPKSPNFGGLWEAGVKSMKIHLVKTIGDSKLTFEEMSTVLCQIEACLNSRPICQLSEHPDDLTPLTPAHFLVGESLLVIPEPYDQKEIVNPLHRWKLVQKMMQHFWTRWSKEYLHNMQQRHKWQIKGEAPKIDDIVIIKELDLPPTKWLLGRVEKLHIGPDGEVRVATLKCKSSVLKRPISKLIKLPRDEELH